MNEETNQINKITNFLGSNWVTVSIILLFSIEASWLAITSQFQMAFDEAWHFGLIQFFSHHLNPFITSQPSSSYALGPIVHNGSFLYHYLLSFPYRLIAHFTSNLKVQIISLRFINISMAIASLLIMRKIFTRLGFSRPLSNIILLIFAFTPIVTVLSAQINYDNLVILSIAATLYLLIRFIQQLNSNVFELKTLLGLICLSLYASEVKYSYLPVLIGVTIVISYALISKRNQNKKQFKSLIRKSYANVSKKFLVIITAATLFGSVLFVGYYGIDMVKYHYPVPQCNQVLSVKDCEQYYSWDRNYTVFLAYHDSGAHTSMNIFHYTYFWFKAESYQMFAEIIPTGGQVNIDRTFYVILVSLSVVAVFYTLANIRKIYRENKVFVSVLFIAFLYLFFLWIDNYKDYLHLGQPLAIQGRYVVPVLIYIYALFGLSLSHGLKNIKRSTGLYIKTVVAATAVFGFVYFGGYVRYSSNISPYTSWIHIKPISPLSKIGDIHIKHI